MRRLQDYSLCKFWIDVEIFEKYKLILSDNITVFNQIKQALDNNIEKKRENYHRFYFFSA
jgi:hypothetical protein